MITHVLNRGGWTLPVKLGKRPPKYDPRTLQFARYVSRVLPAYPKFADWMSRAQDWGMMLNDTLGDCTIACAGHQVQAWTTYASSEVIIPDSSILLAYESPETGGYVPGDPSTDNGCAIIDVLNYWRQTGIGGHKILAYVQLDPRNAAHVRCAIDLFGSVYIGLALPITAQAQNGCWWVSGVTGDGAPGSWGGHAIPIMWYSPKIYQLVTWGQTWWLTPGFLDTYCDEAYAIISQDWIEANGLSPSQFNLAQLQADLAEVAA